METIIGNRHIWQRILEFATDGAFILDVPRPDGTILTHPLVALRQTCKAMRDMIPSPTYIPPDELLFKSVEIGSCALCEYAYRNFMRDVRDCDVYLFAAQIKPSASLAVSLDHARIVEFLLTTPSRRDFDVRGYLEVAMDKACWGACIAILRAYPDLERVAMMKAGTLGRADIINKLKHYGISCYPAFEAACWAGHAGLCEAMIDAGDVDLEEVRRYLDLCTQWNMNICALYRKCLRRINRLDAEFYNHAMSQFAAAHNAAQMQQLHEWSVEDGIRPDYVEILLRWHSDRVNPIAGVCNLIRDFARS